MGSRTIHLDGIQNARDLGGLRTTDGRTIRSGYLLRSADLAGASKEDVTILKEKWHLSTIIDLRTDTERWERPDVDVESADYVPIPVFDEQVVGISHEKGLGASQIGAAIPDMERLYRMMVTDGSCRRDLGRAAKCVMEHDFAQGSVLWHCTEGKDRCGLLTMVLLLALRVDRQQIMEDHLLTNEVNGPKAERYYRQMLAAGKTEREAGAVRDVFLAKASYLDSAFSAMDERYADAEDFLCEGLYIPRASIAAFRKNVLCDMGVRS